MKRFCTALFTSFMLVAFSVPAWANGAPKTKQQYKIDKHKHKVLKQYLKLKRKYNGSIVDARKMFLEYLGSSLPCSDTDVEAVRNEYEQQITQLNATIASQERRLTDLKATIASQEQQFTDLKATIASQEQQFTDLNATIASQQQQLADLNATIASQKQQLESCQQDMDKMTQQCLDQLDTAYNDGMTAGMQTCAATASASEPQQTNSWSTGSHYPYALDVDGNGNTYIMERNYRSVVGYDSTGAQITQWTSNTLLTPMDLAVDSQGNIYILDQRATEFLQKYDPSGQPMNFVSSSVQVLYPMGLFIDSQDNVYITDKRGAYGGRILKFDSTGALVATFGEVSDSLLAGQEYRDIAVDEAQQTIYIVTLYSHAVAKFSMDGTYLGAWQGDLSSPYSIAIGAQGQVFVADTYNNQIDQYDADGNLTYTISSNQLLRPFHIVVDDTGKLFTAVESIGEVLVYQ